MTTLIRQQPCRGLDQIGPALREAFETARVAIDAGDPTVIAVRSADLLGQGSLEDAAVATGLLGLMRALVFEGGSKGWQVNVVALDTDGDVPEDLLALVTKAGLTGQVLNLSAAAIGKVVP